MRAIPNLQILMEEDECNAEDEHDIDESVSESIGHQRWKYLLCKLINAISDRSHPIAFYLDGKINICFFIAIVITP